MEKIKLVIGSDHGGINLKNHILKYIKTLGYEIEDYGTFDSKSCDYPDIAFKVSEAVSRHEFDKGILVCGSGLGMSISANKVKGIRAIACSDCYSAKMSIEHNNANVLCIGERVLGFSLAEQLVKNWLESKFAGGRHQTRIDKIDNYIAK